MGLACAGSNEHDHKTSAPAEAGQCLGHYPGEDPQHARQPQGRNGEEDGTHQQGGRGRQEGSNSTPRQGSVTVEGRWDERSEKEGLTLPAARVPNTAGADVL